MDIQKKLASRLLYLPIDVHEKVLLWLAYRGLKPVSEITVERRGNIRAMRRKGIRRVSTYNYNSPKIKRIRKWIRDAGLFKSTEQGFNTSWHVGKDKDKVIESSKILHKFDYENEYKSGVLLGYPEESAKAYAKNRNLKPGEKEMPVIYPGWIYVDPYLKDKDYAPYLFFAIRADRINEDSLTAKVWADTIRKDVPSLARWYEKWELVRRKREEK